MQLEVPNPQSKSKPNFVVPIPLLILPDESKDSKEQDISEMWNHDFTKAIKLKEKFDQMSKTTDSQTDFKKSNYRPQEHQSAQKVQSNTKHKKNALSKHINKKHNYLKDTKISKTKRTYGIKQAVHNRVKSREKSLLKSRQCLNTQRSKQNQSIVDENQISKLADEFWDNLEQEKKKTRKINNVKERIPISERTTFSTKMKASTSRHSKPRVTNKHFQNKFKNTMDHKQRNEDKIISKTKPKSKRVISHPREIGRIQTKKISKRNTRRPSEEKYYSPIRISPKNNETEKRNKNEYDDQNFEFDAQAHAPNASIDRADTAQNPDSTLQLT